MPNNKKIVKVQPYHSELPNFLLSVIDQMIKTDPYQAFRHDFLHYSLEETVYLQEEHPNTIWLFVNPDNLNHLLSQAPHPLFPSQVSNGSHLGTSQEQEMPLSLTCVNLLNNLLEKQIIEDLRQCEIVSFDQIRLRCEANIYTDPKVLDRDIRRMLAWHQVFRAHSLKTFQYISGVYQKIVIILDKKDYFKKFYEIKFNDLARLMREEMVYKIKVEEWPFIPDSFREYQQIDEYVPTPKSRTETIEQRMLSLKKPVECGSDCVCLSENLPEGEFFCTFSLLDGWETRCANRAKKIECNHQNPSDQQRCRNSQIQKHQRKRCKKEADSEGEIEERITWGIDLYTRNVLYHCLPEIDIQGVKDRVVNEQRKNTFIQRTLVKAFNLLGTQGYDISNVCNFIKQNSEYNHQKEGKQISKTLEQHKEETVLNQNSQLKQWLFSKRDWEYADLLMKNYELSADKSAFRIHTKGKGAICIDSKGIEQGTFLTEYFGQIYELWRWYDRQDFIKEVMKRKRVKNYTPEFYNIALQKHTDDPLGCDMLMVDPSRMGNFSSRFSHSCDPNCGTIITVSNGKYYIGMYAFKDIVYGQELTFDYCSMTESAMEHESSVCLCGMKRCRGFYLQLSNTKMFSNLMDSKNCFYARNSAILRANEPVEQSDYIVCAKYNIKEGFLQNAPKWIVRWMASVLTFIEEEGDVYQESLMEGWRKEYPWQNFSSQQEKQENIKRYSLTSRQQLQSIRLQNLLTSVDKIKYFYSQNENNCIPPIFLQDHQKILNVLIFKQDSVLKQLQDSLIRFKMQELPKIIEIFLNQINKEKSEEMQLSLFRLCCLIVSHKLLMMGEAQFNHQLLSDITFFYAFTHTYFSPSDFNSFEAEEISILPSQIKGEKPIINEKKQRNFKKYSSPFVWGQMASWYKQTIVCPEASLSQDRRGTLSYPLMKSIMRSDYPYEKKSRVGLMRMLREKPANSWPPARGCELSFKNTYKLYGTMLFENVHSKDKLIGHLPKQNLLESCLLVMNANLREKFDLFRRVEYLLSGLPEDHAIYSMIELAGDLDQAIPAKRESHIKQGSQVSHSEPRKKVKRDMNE